MTNAKLTLDGLLADGKKVYIYNNTKAVVGGATIKPAGQIHINFLEPGGKTVSLVIPVTNIPYCLNDYLPARVIANSIELRQYITKGIFKLEDPEAAEKILASEDAQDEISRLNTSKFSQSNVDFNDDNIPMVSNEPTNEIVSETPNLREDTISLKVKDIMLRLESNALNVRKALQELKVQHRNLTPADCSFIISNTKEAQLKKFAQQVLAKMQVEE